MTMLWQPDAERVSNSQMTAFANWLQAEHGLQFSDYEGLHQWSIDHLDQFWSAVWQFTEIIASQPYTSVVEDVDQFPGAKWFPGARLNFAENLMRYRDDRVALIALQEKRPRRTISYAELWTEVEKLASAMRVQGITAGDRVAGLMPNIPETVIAMLATTSIGATWSSCSPDFGVGGACDRFGQIEPRILFTVESYIYNGKVTDCREKVAAIQARLTSLEATIVVPFVDDTPDLDSLSDAVTYGEFVAAEQVIPLTFEQLPFDHPLYIMYSSGTTGAPKCIVHGAGGTLIQHLKEHRLHTDIGRDDILFYFTTCGWMMWNWLVSGLSTGCALVLYEGSPFADDGHILLDAIDREGITVFGTSAKYIAALEKQGFRPAISHNLSSLRTILSTGSPLLDSSFEYVYRDFDSDVCLSSIAGGTDIISCFMLGNPNLPVYTGEIQCRGLGMAVEFLDDDGRTAVGTTGELVCTRPFPSTPIGFWNDAGDSRFRAAYFDQHPGTWTHGDYGELTGHGGVVIHGRSDAVLNPSGVRIGTAEIYRQVETIPEVVDSIVVSQEWQDDERIVLFVVMQPGLTMTENLADKIRSTIRQNTTPRHVPAKVLAVADIPRTISGKIVELAVRKVIHGREVDNTDALENPEALDLFKDLAELVD